MSDDNPTENSTTDRVADMFVGEMDKEGNPTEGTVTDKVADMFTGEMDNGGSGGED